MHKTGRCRQRVVQERLIKIKAVVQELELAMKCAVYGFYEA